MYSFQMFMFVSKMNFGRSLAYRVVITNIVHKPVSSLEFTYIF